MRMLEGLMTSGREQLSQESSTDVLEELNLR